MKIRTRSKAAYVALAVAALGAAFLAGRAWAGGVPATGALTYSGTLEDATGAPLTGSHNVQVNFWSAASVGTNVCPQTASTPIVLDAGRFTYPLPDTCTAAVKASPDVWAEVLVDGASLGRTKIGAVPYAVEAGHATNADSATNATGASGALATTLNGLAAKTSLPQVTDWQTFSPNMRGSGGTPNPVPGQTSTGKYRRVGDSEEVYVHTSFTAAPTCGSEYWVWDPPFAIDTTKLVGLPTLGTGEFVLQPGNTVYACTATRSGTGIALDCNGATQSLTCSSPPATVGAASGVSLHFTAPVVGWTSTQ